MSKKAKREQIDRDERAFLVAKEVADEENIPDIAEYRGREYNAETSRFFKIEADGDLRIYAEIVSRFFGLIRVEISLKVIAAHILYYLERLLTKGRAREVLDESIVDVLEKRKINMLTLFNCDESGLDEFVRERSKQILNIFLLNIEIFSTLTVDDAFGHSLTGYLVNKVRPEFAEHWKDLGLPARFSLLTESQLDSVRQHNANVKKWYLGDLKQWLNINTLADQVDDLRKLFKAAKVEFMKQRDDFFKANRRATIEEWDNKWLEIAKETFPALHYTVVSEIEWLRPFELAQKQVAFLYGYSEDYIRNKIRESRKLKGKRQDKSG
jgi:hypothetical protein